MSLGGTTQEYYVHKSIMDRGNLNQMNEAEEERECDESKEQYFQNLIQKAHAAISN